MTITVVTAATASDLTTVPRVQAELDVSGNEVLLLAMIRVASAAIQKYCARTFAEERVKETFGVSSPSTQWYLRRRPVVTVHTLKFNDGEVTQSWEVENAEAGKLFMPSGFTPTPILVQGIILWPEGRNELRYEADYTAGYILPSAGAASPPPNLPADVEQGAVEFVKSRWQQRPRDSSVKSEKLGDYAVTYADQAAQPGGLPPAAIGLLEPYRRVLM